MIRRNFLKAGLSASAAAASSSTAASAATEKARKKPNLLFYHDGRHPLIYMYEPPMQKEQYEAAVDELAGTPIEALMFWPGRRTHRPARHEGRRTLGTQRRQMAAHHLPARPPKRQAPHR